MADFVVSNTGPLISLEKMQNGYDFIRKLYNKIVIPPSVLSEISQGCPTPHDYLKVHGIEGLMEIRPPSLITEIPGIERLHKAEREAISLASQLKSPLLIEETLGRKIALSMGLKISGIAGQVVKAFRQGIIGKTETNQKLKELLNGGRINKQIYEALSAR